MKVPEKCTSEKMELCISSAAANVRKIRSDSEEFQEKLSGLKNETEKFCNAKT